MENIQDTLKEKKKNQFKKYIYKIHKNVTKSMTILNSFFINFFPLFFFK